MVHDLSDCVQHCSQHACNLCTSSERTDLALQADQVQDQSEKLNEEVDSQTIDIYYCYGTALRSFDESRRITSPPGKDNKA